MRPPAQTITRLLREWQGGKEEALGQLMPLVYGRLRAIANSQLKLEHPGNTISATALVHEVYLRFVGTELEVQDRAHFYAVCARVMRRILIDHARSHRRLKRGGDAVRWNLGESVLVSREPSGWLLDLNEALERLEVMDPRKAAVVELLFFGGMEQDMAAAHLKISPATLRRDLRLARAWLHAELSPRP